FDVIYSSLTWMHIEDKQSAINKIAALLNPDGLFVLSVDKNPDEFIDTGTRKIRVYPDDPEMTAKNIRASGLTLLEQYDTEFAVVFVTVKK
ncbi:MAG: methyltransferase domain-containing protein, partial [Oscillospiraceae bacterium]|nr:methyltransferase domain-containing protein [Oscillospiraceae bacterium]